MAALNSKLRSVAFTTDGSAVGIAFWCPGCGESHAVCTRGDPALRPVWGWDGNIAAPTITPSIKVTKGHGHKPPDVCHSFVRAGSIQFLGDCTHALAGNTVPLPDWPSASDEDEFYLAAPHDKVPLP
jgi:hypothetical protein